jgi:RNA polymerase sigma factor (sigma-70 family)
VIDRQLFEPGELAHLSACADWLGRPRHGYIVDELRRRRDLRRLKRRGSEVSLDAVPEPVDGVEGVPEQAMRREKIEMVRSAVTRLGDRQKQAIELRLAGESVADSAQKMSCTIWNVDLLLRHARRKLGLMLLTLSACAAPPQVLDELTEQAITEQGRPAAALRAMSEASYAPQQRASVHIRHMPSLADVRGGLPIVLPPKHLPVAGREFELIWLTRPAPDIEGKRPGLSCALLLSLTEPGQPRLIPGASGAMLQVPPHYIFVPQQVEKASATGAAFQGSEDGIIVLRLTLPSSLAGVSAWCQLLVADSRVPAGCVSTPTVELHIGS